MYAGFAHPQTYGSFASPQGIFGQPAWNESLPFSLSSLDDLELLLGNQGFIPSTRFNQPQSIFDYVYGTQGIQGFKTPYVSQNFGQDIHPRIAAHMARDSSRDLIIQEALDTIRYNKALDDIVKRLVRGESVNSEKIVRDILADRVLDLESIKVIEKVIYY